VWFAGLPHTMQIARVLVMYSAIASHLRHRVERLAEIILVEPGDDDALAAVGELVGDRRQVLVEELPFIDPTTSVSASTRSRSAREFSTARDGIRISLCDTMWYSS